MVDVETPGIMPTAKARESLSQFVARVLDQLSISAWLPAGALVGLILLLGQMRANDGDLGAALKDIGSLRPGALVLLVVAVILGTMATQAFEFEAIRLLEGYWGTSFVGRHVSDLGMRWHTWRRNRLKKRHEVLDDAAFAIARQTMFRRSVPVEIIDVLERERSGLSLSSDEATTEAAHAVGWRVFAPATKVRWLDDMEVRLRDYPVADHRVLPTALGNVLRAAEDRAFPDSGEALETSVVGIFNDLPAAVQAEHDQHRSRLELYCSMVIVFLVAAGAAYPMLRLVGWEVPVGLAVASALLSYRAAIASARKYGLVLQLIGSMAAASRPSESGEPGTSVGRSTAWSPSCPKGNAMFGRLRARFRGPSDHSRP